MNDPHDKSIEVALLTLPQVAGMVNMGERTFRRLVDSGAAPTPVRINRMVRWEKKKVEAWIAAGCPRIRSATIATEPQRIATGLH